jgi:hypothetical protein
LNLYLNVLESPTELVLRSDFFHSIRLLKNFSIVQEDIVFSQQKAKLVLLEDVRPQCFPQSLYLH